MNNDIFSGKWNQLKGEMKKQWGNLTDDEIDRLDGEKDVVIGKIQEKYGKSKEQAESEFNRWYNGLDPSVKNRLNRK
ncbi:CsbD family protein [Clostridium algidicarnis]|uniref:CsbD family protein n=1 Tax=Clostridium algidicarnis TaxID=37659 RepID=UPI0016251FDA|nr:CsbD family protein [Clostridium algidicarnis]MBB6696471.1 CsbD family protein [Clostridium algidicarnis]MBU3205798.1 CsbD family protein [Clostridium algidicarnis]